MKLATEQSVYEKYLETFKFYERLEKEAKKLKTEALKNCRLGYASYFRSIGVTDKARCKKDGKFFQVSFSFVADGLKVYVREITDHLGEQSYEEEVITPDHNNFKDVIWVSQHEKGYNSLLPIGPHQMDEYEGWKVGEVVEYKWLPTKTGIITHFTKHGKASLDIGKGRNITRHLTDINKVLINC